MAFRRDLDGEFALFRVSVRNARPRDTARTTLEAYVAPFTTEIGYKKGTDLPSSVGLLPARQRTFSVYASGDRRTVRAVDVHVLHAFGHIHILHFETLQKSKPRFRRDLRGLLAQYQAKAGRAVYGPIIGRWINQNDGPTLDLTEDMRFTLGPLAGGYSTDGGRLVLALADGRESYQYQQRKNILILKNVNLKAPMIYRRSGGPRIQLDEDRSKKRPKRLTSKQLHGRWRVLDQASTEPLVLHLAPSGSVSFGPLSGRWRYRNGLLTIRSVAGRTVTYHVSRSGRRLVMGGGDLEKELQLEREDE